MSNFAHTVYTCTQCDYTTSRSYNLKRHMNLVHDDEGQNVVTNGQFVVEKGHVVVDKRQNVVMNGQHVVNHGNCEHICDKCGKALSCKRSLKRHAPICKGPILPNQCPVCERILSDRHSKWKHMKVCNGVDKIHTNVLPQQTAQTINNIGTQNNTTNNITNNNITNNNNQYLVLQFPSKDYDTDFAFLRDHIPLSDLKRIWDNKPLRAFLQYSKAILNRKENQVVRKDDLKSKHCTIHTKHGWENTVDDDVMPEMVFQMSVSAKDAWEECKNNKVTLKETTWGAIDKHLDKINTEDGDAYENAKYVLRRQIVEATKDQ